MDASNEYFATSGSGLSGLLAQELRALGIKRVRPLPNGVAFFGRYEQALRACLWLRTASRVLLVIGRVAAGNADELYQSALEIAWEEHIGATASFAIDAQGQNEQLRNTTFIAQRVKDAVVDRLRQARQSRPDVQRQRPDVLINVRLRDKRATLAIDLSGEPLHRRGYRTVQHGTIAPLRETLAAALVMSAGWTAPAAGTLAAGGGASSAAFSQPAFLLDPLCGSGTIAIEAALILADRAPGLLRDYWGFSGWLGHDPALWQDLLDEADNRAEQRNALLQAQCFNTQGEKGAANLCPPVMASDNDAEAIKTARASARLAGVEQLIGFVQSDVLNLRLPDGYAGQRGVLATNPPYAERLSTAAQLPALYAALGELVRQQAGGFDAAIITPDGLLEAFLTPAFGAPPALRIETYNGPLEATIHVWGSSPAQRAERRSAAGPAAGSAALPVSDTAAAGALAANATAAPAAAAGALAPNATAAPAAAAPTPAGAPAAPTAPAPAGALATSTAPPAGPPAGPPAPTPAGAPVAPPAPTPAAPLSKQAQAFANRLAKMARHRAKWAQRSQVTCYRVYDADLPDYNVAIDLYEGAAQTAAAGRRWLHIAEYQAPASIDPDLAMLRLAEVLRIAPTVLGVDSANVFLKRRIRAKGGSQYSQGQTPEKGQSPRIGTASLPPAESAKNQPPRADIPPRAAASPQPSHAAATSAPAAPLQPPRAAHLIAEGGLLFEVDLATRLDTGIFLDHRIARGLLRQMAAGRDCLNLFAYTGTASVYMAAGGAQSVTTVDLSHTYLDWARRNLAANGFASASTGGEDRSARPSRQPAAPASNRPGGPSRQPEASASLRTGGPSRRPQPDRSPAPASFPQLFFVQADALRWVSERRALGRPGQSPADRSTPGSSALGRPGQNPAAPSIPGRPGQNPAAPSAFGRPGQSPADRSTPGSSTPDDPGIPQRFGLIFADVPTFSNSRRMGTRSWDVQRDHVDFLVTVSRLLTPDGAALFSTNLKGFQPDIEALAKARVSLKDITARTVAPDFERTPTMHRCYILTKEPN